MASGTQNSSHEYYDEQRATPRSPTRQTQRPSSYQALPPGERGPARTSTNVRQPADRPSDGARPKPVAEAVNSAFASTHMDNKVSPDLVELITQEVINNLRLNGIATGQASPPKPSSTTTPASSSIPPRDVYTPPSPSQEDGSRDKSKPSGLDELSGDATWERIGSSKDPGSRARSPSPPATAFRNNASRPAPPSKTSTGDATTLEKIWQPLFDREGNPTPRLSQFLRGLAIHLIDDYEPRQSLVITPQKMLKFYGEVSIAEEIYPWTSIFGGKMKDSSISHMYRDLKCEHHFVQPKATDKPTIPALTPSGFECWMTHIIRAHPDEEFQRFAKAALHMPISNFDDPRERFPKELSRRLFPQTASASIQETFEDSILADPVIELSEIKKKLSASSSNPLAAKAAAPMERLAPGASPPKPTDKSSSAQSLPPPPPPPPPPTYSTNSDRLKSSVPAASSDAAVTSETSEDESSHSVPIERERKPYHAQPGGGKMYDNSKAASSTGIPTVTTSSSHSRSQTMSTSARPSVDDTYARAGTRIRAGSVATGPPPVRRDRSPYGASLYHTTSTPSSYARSDHGDQSNSNAYSFQPEDSEDDGNRLRRTQSARNRRSYVPPPIGTKSSGYEDEYHRRASTQNSSSSYGNSSYYPNQSSRY